MRINAVALRPVLQAVFPVKVVTMECSMAKALETHECFCKRKILHLKKFMAGLTLTLKLNSSLSALAVWQASPVLLVLFGKDKGNCAAPEMFN